METRANYLMVGAFVLALITGLTAFVVWFGKFQFDQKFKRYDILFHGSVTGLNLGSVVRYSGVRVGEVIVVRLEPKHPEFVRVRLEVEDDTPVRQNTVASIELEGLTGGRYVLLSTGAGEAEPLMPKPDQKFAVIKSRPSSLDKVLASAPEILEGAKLLIANGNLLLNADNRANFAGILDNTERFTATLAEQGDNIEALFADAAETMENLRIASASVEKLATTLETEAATLFQQANSTLVVAEDLAISIDGTAKQASADLRALTNKLGGTAASLSAMADEIQVAVEENREQINDFTSAGLYELTTLITEARDFLVGLNRVTTEVERDPARFLFGNQQQGYEANQ
jgi:phospholipid/cholesterol/gamma-HCH transport system substrate-binding protein